MKTNYHTLVREQADIGELPLDSVLPTRDFVDPIFKIEQSNWLRTSMTQRLFKELSQQIDELENRARDLACNYHQQQNPHEIVNCLVRAAELRKLKEIYGRIS